MFSQSITVKFLKTIWVKFKDSATFSAFLAITGFFGRVYEKSILKRYVNSGNFLNKNWENSFIAKILDKIYLFFLKVIFGIFKIFKFESSISYSLVERTVGKIKFHRIVAILFALIFLVYSSWWNNIYALGIAGVLFFMILYKDRGKTLLPSKIDFFMVLFLVTIPLGLVAASNKADAIRISMMTITSLLILAVTVFSLNDNQKVKGFLKIMSFGIFITAVIAIIQRIIGVEVDPEFVDVANNKGMPGRVFSTMENPNNYAEILVLFVPFMFALFVNEKKAILKVMWIVLAGVTMVALLMTYSRSCYVAILIAMIVFILIYDYKLILPALILGLILIPFLPETVMNRIMTIGSLSDSSNSYRLYIWEVCAKLIGNYGISGLGIGPDAFARFYKAISYEKAIKAPHSHMLYMELILEYGVVGFIGFMGYYIRIIRNGFKSISLADKEGKAYLAAGIGALLGISFVCMAEYIWFYPRDGFAHFIVMGILVAVIKNISRESSGNR